MTTRLTPDQAKSLHLYNLAHTFPSTPLHKQYALQFDRTTLQSQIQLPQPLQHKICKLCGVLQIPGITQSFRIKYGGKGSGVRRLRYRCLSCGGAVYSDPLIAKREPPPPPPPPQEEKEDEVVVVEVAAPVDDSATKDAQVEASAADGGSGGSDGKGEAKVNATSDAPEADSVDTPEVSLKNKSAKTRARKRKANSELSNLLKRKKNQDQRQSKSNSLNLMDFMQ
ncbi:uncharacterized protein LODBEIA_P56750 [Lodderomyces beijingensis]|uniref:Uncharacterized protein n=1 Tax=Lodderomyces beijingensis TaxID=1775926 RepID=A0ABP0ZVQ8_9ASCO